MIMIRHTDDEIDQAAHRFEQLADELDPATAEVSDTKDLPQVAPSPKRSAQPRPAWDRRSKRLEPAAGPGTRSRLPSEFVGKQLGSGSPTRLTSEARLRTTADNAPSRSETLCRHKRQVTSEVAGARATCTSRSKTEDAN